MRLTQLVTLGAVALTAAACGGSANGKPFGPMAVCLVDLGGLWWASRKGKALVVGRSSHLGIVLEKK